MSEKSEKRIRTIGIKSAAYDILKKVSKERINTTKPNGIVDIATEAIERTFGSSSEASNGMEA